MAINSAKKSATERAASDIRMDLLVDTLATYDQVDALADWIDTKGRRLSRIYITHGHGDHWLGLDRLIQRFPGAKGLATTA